LGARVLERLIGLISITILARLLTPSDFGLVAIASIVVAAIQVFTQFGFDWALVRYKELTPSDLNTAWTFRALLGLGVLGFLVIVGPFAAEFFKQAALRPVLIVLGVGAFIVSLENIGTVYFRRDFTFDREFLIRAIAKVSGFVTTVSLALLTRSYWALVWGTVATNLATTIASYSFHPYRPRLSLGGVRALLAFSSWLLVGSLAGFFRQQFAKMYLGRVFGPATTGLFSVAEQIAIIPLEIAMPINRVAYSKYTQDTREDRPLTSSYIAIASLIWALALPISVGTVAVAPEVVALLLGHQWTGAVPVLRLLAIGMAFNVMVANTHYVYWALGLSRITAALSITSAVAIIPLSIVGSHLAGYVGVAWAFAVQSAVIAPINFVLLRRFVGISFNELWSKVWRVALGASAMLAFLRLTFGTNPYDTVYAAALKFAVAVTAGGAVYMAVVYGVWQMAGQPAGPERLALDLLKDRLARRFMHPSISERQK
jgi:O-antigen/teichoic acid export membrane protein